MRLLCLLFFSLGMAGCSTPDAVSTGTSVRSPSSAASSGTAEPPSNLPPAPLEQVPSELSLEHFSAMRLEGTDFTLGDIQADTNVYTRYTISYRSNGLLISGILNIPKGDGPFPLVVLNHGYIDPVVYTNGRGLKREQDYLAREGFAVLHTDYRGHAFSDESPDTREIYDASLEYSMDSANAILALRAANLPTVSTTRVGMMGHSLGGGIALNIATARPDLIDATILYAPVHADAWENFLRWRDMRDEGDRTRAALGSRESNPSAWDALSSQTLLHQIDDPVLLFHGSSDDDVPKAWSDDLASRLEQLGKDITYVEYEGEEHEFVPQFGDFMARTSDFLRENLTPPEASSAPIYDESRITKKPFGIRISPETSPVDPERFSGYHTGTDFEVFEGEDPHAIAVTALCTGEILFRKWVNGYGGVVVQSCTWNDQPVTVLYGHMAIDSVDLSAGDHVNAGQHLGHLGAGYGPETDNERPHLHLSVHRGSQVELRGYVQQEDHLDAWLDPVQLLP